jgi:DNA-binding response OmpR family regulator
MRILIGEDDPKVAAFLEQGLQEEAFEVTLARDGDAALAMARQERYDVILLDVMLPKRSGIDVLRELRHLGLGTPVLMVSARDGRDDIQMAVDAGASGYLTKPFRFDDLLYRLHALGGKPGSA